MNERAQREVVGNSCAILLTVMVILFAYSRIQNTTQQEPRYYPPPPITQLERDAFALHEAAEKIMKEGLR